MLALGKNDEALTAFDAAIATAEPGRERDVVTAAKIGVLANLGQRRQAAELFDTVARPERAHHPARPRRRLSGRARGQRRGRPRPLRQGAGGWRAHTSAALDAAYVSKRLAQNEQALAYFRDAIDATVGGTMRMPAQKLFDVRREVAEIERQWGAYTTLNYNAVGVAPATPLAPPPATGNVLQAGFEAYWRPPVIGYRNGRIVELFARTFQTLADASGGPTGTSTQQGAVGARWKPLSDINLILEGARLFALGTYGRNDWLTRVAASHGEGTDLRVEQANWTMVAGLRASTDHFYQTPQI